MVGDRSALVERLTRTVRDVRDFPKPGIVFKDITPVLADAALFVALTDAMAAPFADRGVTHVAGVESRGFILAAPIAQRLGAGFVPIRKPGKLPWKTAAREYALEYGTDQLEVHLNSWTAGARVLLVDDVLATGGTACAACELIEQVGGAVAGCSFFLAVTMLGGAAKLNGREVRTLLDV